MHFSCRPSHAGPVHPLICHIWGSHALHPSLCATAILISSSDRHSPTDVIGGAASQSPECGDDAANSLALSMSVVACDQTTPSLLLLLLLLLLKDITQTVLVRFMHRIVSNKLIDTPTMRRSSGHGIVIVLNNRITVCFCAMVPAAGVRGPLEPRC